MAEPPRVTCRITPVADIRRDRPCLTERLREEQLVQKATGLRTAKSEGRTGSRAERTRLPLPLERIRDPQNPPTRQISMCPECMALRLMDTLHI